MQFDLIGYTDQWTAHIRTVICRRLPHLDAENIPEHILLSLVDHAPALRLMFTARHEAPMGNSVLCNLTYSALQLHAEHVEKAFAEQLRNAALRLNARQEFSVEGLLTELRAKNAPPSPYHGDAILLLLALRRAQECDAESAFTNPLCWTKDSVQHIAKQVKKRFAEQFGVNLSASKSLDLTSELMGFQNGFQQLKPIIQLASPEKAVSWQLKQSLEVLHYILVEMNNLPFYNQQLVSQIVSSASKTQLDTPQAWADLYSQLTQLWSRYQTCATSPRTMQDWSIRARKAICKTLLLLAATLQPKHNLPAPARPTIARMAIADAAAVAAEQFGTPENARDIIESYSKGDDGLAVVEELNRRHYWSISRHDMDVFDEFVDAVEARQRDAEHFWGLLFELTPPLPVGTCLSTGVIDGICTHTPATYLVISPGHNDVRDGYSRRLIRFENAKVCAPQGCEFEA